MRQIILAFLLIISVINVSFAGVNEDLLFYGVEKNDINLVKRAVDKGAAINYFKYGSTSLNQAVGKYDGSLEIVKFLLDKGANPNLGIAYGYGVPNFLRAVTRANDKRNENYGAALLQLLIRARANIHIQDSFGNNAIHYVCFSDDPNEKLLKFLIAGKININHQNNNGETPIMCLIIKPLEYSTFSHSFTYTNASRREVTKILYDSGANFNLKNKQNLTALQIAVKVNDQEMVKILSQY